MLRLLIRNDGRNPQMPEYGDYDWSVDVNGQVIAQGRVLQHHRRRGWRALLLRVANGREADQVPEDPLAWLGSNYFERTVSGAIRTMLREHGAIDAIGLGSAVKRIVQSVRGEVGLTVPKGHRGLGSGEIIDRSVG